MPDQKKTDPLALEISQQALDEALRSVERAAAAAAAPPPPGSDPGADSAAARAALRGELLQARQALRQREAELEASQQMGRKTLERLKEEHDRALRALADLENLRKRSARERDEHARFSQEKLLRELLPVLDNLDRALDHAGAPVAQEALTSGIEMTRKLFHDVLDRHGVRPVEALRHPFDPRLHEAMQSVESEDAPGTVLSEMVHGYTLHERLLRPAMVVVSRARAPAAEGGSPAGQEAPAPGPAAAGPGGSQKD